MDDPGSVLRKKLRPKPATQGKCHAVLRAQAADAFRRAAKSCHGIDLSVEHLEVTRIAKPAMLDGLPEIALLVSLNGAEDARGLMMFDGAMIDALIEQQTLGRVAKSARVDRPVTAIDASLSRPFMEAALSALDANFEGAPEAQPVSGFEIATQITDRAALDLDLEATEFDHLCARLDLGPGLKTGQVDLFYPVRETALPATARGANPEARAAMKAILPHAKAKLTASLPPMALGLRELTRLEVGSIIPVSKDVMGQARLSDSRGRVFSTARLGQLNGARAVMISMEGRPEAEAPPPVPEPKPVESPGYDVKAVEPAAGAALEAPPADQAAP